MASDLSTPLVLDIAREFISFVRALEPTWKRAFLRFTAHDSMSETKASYVHASGVDLVDVMKHKPYFHPLHQRGLALLNAVGKSQGLWLLVVDSSFNYEIKFEYEDMSRWKISKLANGTGVPVGFE